MNNTHFEIERKFLIEYPDIKLLDSLEVCTRADIIQIYTKDKIRIRKWTENGKTTYIKTKKEKVSEITRIETEQEIDKAEFDRLCTLADSDLRPIEKRRFRYPFKNKIIEIDIFPFWTDKALCEVELESENEEFSLPSFIKVIREVTFDKRYRNSALAKEIP